MAEEGALDRYARALGLAEAALIIIRIRLSVESAPNDTLVDYIEGVEAKIDRMMKGGGP